MINASFDRSDPRDTTRGGVSLAPHAKSSMGGAGMRNTKARGSVDGLVRTETFVGDAQTRRRSHESTESHRLQASLPKNHVQPQFDINLRLTTLNFYENREKTSGVC